MRYVTMREMPPLPAQLATLATTWEELEMPGYAPTFTLTLLLQDNENLPFPGLMVILPGVDERGTMPFEDLGLPMPPMWAGQLARISHDLYVTSAEGYIDEVLRKWGRVTAAALRLKFPNGFDEDLLDDDDEDENNDAEFAAAVDRYVKVRHLTDEGETVEYGLPIFAVPPEPFSGKPVVDFDVAEAPDD